METANYIGGSMEIWKIIEGYDHPYEISNLGRVKFPEIKTSHLNQWGKECVRVYPEKISEYKKGNAKGYIRITLRKNNKNVYASLHRLVAEAFIPNPNNLPQVNHKDEDKTNNCVDNLEWCTTSYNINYGTRNERVGRKISIYKRR
jgi:hypothetical protein